VVRPAQSRAALFEARARRLWERYRFTAEQWMAQYAFQGGLCMYCGKPGGDLYSRGRVAREPEPLVYEHEHEPPYRFRGLGHGPCNTVAGRVERVHKAPPAWQPGGVAHQVPAEQQARLDAAAAARVAARERQAAARRASWRRSKARARRGEPTLAAQRRARAGERTTYHYPDPPATGTGGRAGRAGREGLVAAALADRDRRRRRDRDGG
jgi:hypothetical protein